MKKNNKEKKKKTCFGFRAKSRLCSGIFQWDGDSFINVFGWLKKIKIL